MSRFGWRSPACGSAFILALAVAAPLAEAQETQPRDLPVPKFNPSVPGDRFFGVPSPYAAGDLTFHAAATLDYAREPFSLARENADGSEEIGAIVSDQMFVHVAMNLSLASYIALNVSMPFAVLSQGDAPAGDFLAFEEPSGPGFGDLRIGMRIRLFGKYHDPFQLAAGGYVWAPTGTEDNYVSDPMGVEGDQRDHVHGMPHLIMGGRNDWFVWSAMVGPHLRQFSRVGPVTMGHQMEWGLGAGVLLLDKRLLQLHVETSGAVDVTAPDARTTNAEILGGIKFRIPSADMIEIGAGAGPGISTGIGTPLARALFQLSYTPVIEVPKKDFDKDGILDDVDACPSVPGVPSDDSTRRTPAPTCPASPASDPKKHGCPKPEGPRQGRLPRRAVDACPDVPGVASDDPKKHGCPLPKDRDNDGIIDDEDACPDEKGRRHADPKKNGCPPDATGRDLRRRRRLPRR
jgi:OOP family OmpA-OmpF porin